MNVQQPHHRNNTNFLKFVTVLVHMNHPLVIFDGVCNLCNATVDFLIRHDRTGRLHFGAFQDDVPAALLRHHGVEGPPTTVYLIEGDQLYIESEAILHLLRYLGPGWQVFRLGRIIPRPLRDRIYKWVSRNRYRWFGTKATCRIPTPEERERFL